MERGRGEVLLTNFSQKAAGKYFFKIIQFLFGDSSPSILASSEPGLCCITAKAPNAKNINQISTKMILPIFTGYVRLIKTY
jgi:hypothetical protein